MSSGFFADKRVVVTGGAGFLGRFVVAALRARGCRDVIVPRSRDYDLTEMSAVRKLYDDAKPDLVVHLAAQVGGIGANRQNPGKYFYDNLMMGVQLIEEGRRRKLPKLVAAGTICAYPKFTPVPFKEDDLWNGYPEETNAPYGLAKKMLLVQSQAYREQYDFNSVIVFPVNLYGPHDNFDLNSSHVIPALIRKIACAIAAGHDDVTIWGDGTPTREFLYVEDCAAGILAACEVYDGSLPINLGSGREISIAHLAELIGRLMDYRGHFVYDASKPNGQPRRQLAVERAKELLHWQAQTTLENGLEKTIRWWKEQS